MDHTLTSELVIIKPKIRQLNTISEWRRNFPCQKKMTVKIRGSNVHGFTLTRELVFVEVKVFQFNTLPKCIWDWTCQKEGLWEIQGKIVWWIIHLPSSLLLERVSLSSLIQFPSDSGIWPVKKNDSAKFRGKSVHGLYAYPWVCCRREKGAQVWYISQVIREFDLSKKI